MSCFVDTSALYALMDADDENHEPAAKAWKELVSMRDTLVSSNYVMVECCALIQRRLGLAALGTFTGALCPVMRIEWIGHVEHEAAISSVLAAGKSRLSLVDCVSFQIMRRLGIRDAFCFDQQFVEQGFICRP